jgi:predicted DNA binding CopG/RHH family protein
MPNQRSKLKAPITGYFPKAKVEAIKAWAAEQGMTVKDLIEALIDQELKKANKEDNHE